MADDNILRSYRSNDLARRTSAPAAPRDSGGSDPLAELARLIGQSDPFADLERTSSHATQARQRTDSAPSDWRKTAAALARESMREAPAADPHFEEVDSAIAAAKSLRTYPDDQLAYPEALSSHAAFDPAFDRAPLAHGGYADGPHDGHDAATSTTGSIPPITLRHNQASTRARTTFSMARRRQPTIILMTIRHAGGQPMAWSPPSFSSAAAYSEPRAPMDIGLIIPVLARPMRRSSRPINRPTRWCRHQPEATRNQANPRSGSVARTSG